jgi:methylthioribose-1-phosphate isomerase
MDRIDEDLPFLLKFENVAEYRDGQVIILDRRRYPHQIDYVVCDNYEEVATAIADMVTQSGGPWLAASWAMVATARTVRSLRRDAAVELLDRAINTLASARPTTGAKLARHLRNIKDTILQAMETGKDPEIAAVELVRAKLIDRYSRSQQMGKLAASLLQKESTLLTHCFAETLLPHLLLAAREAGKQISLVCTETRPYLQGTRLTATSALELGFHVTVITDGMAAYLLSRGEIHAFVTGADVITLDGHVVNKIGTLAIALACKAYGVPYYVLGDPSADHPTASTVHIEERDGSDVLRCMGQATGVPGVVGRYPAFDITPPDLVRAVVTSRGIFAPTGLGDWS